jgi:alkanesulfonate monooxygenase SsuD/methylene tetrahydromethanopterin reductase-like flavin-dependent oxidoreductase (luciferase family)
MPLLRFIETEEKSDAHRVDDGMRLAFTQKRFSYGGKYYTFHDVGVIPKPYQQPHPPLRAAATTRETFGLMGRLGLPIFAGVGAAARQSPSYSRSVCLGRR